MNTKTATLWKLTFSDGTSATMQAVDYADACATWEAEGDGRTVVEGAPAQKTFDIKTKYLDEKNVHINWHSYRNNRPAIEIVSESGEPLCMATVNLEIDLNSLGKGVSPNTHVFIKNYSENEGVLEALEKAEIVKRTGFRAPTGFVEIDLCELLIPIGG